MDGNDRKDYVNDIKNMFEEKYNDSRLNSKLNSIYENNEDEDISIFENYFSNFKLRTIFSVILIIVFGLAFYMDYSKECSILVENIAINKDFKDITNEINKDNLYNTWAVFNNYMKNEQ